MPALSPLKAALQGRPSSPPAPPGGRLPRWLRHALRLALELGLHGAAVALSYRLAYELRFHAAPWVARFPITGEDPGWGFYGRFLYALVPLWLAIFGYSARLYTRPWLRSMDRFLLVLKGTLLGALATLSASYIYGRLEYSRQLLLLSLPLIALLVSLADALARQLDSWVARFESNSPLLVLGGGRVAQLIRENLVARHPGIPIHELESWERPEEVLEAARLCGAAEAVLARPSLPHGRVLELAEACDSAGIGLRLIPGLLELRLGEVQLDESLGLPAYRVQHTSLSPAHYAVKRAFDILVSLGVLAVCAAPFAAITLLIRLDSRGPVFYRQKRLGYKGRVFDMLKFRTMVADAESRLGAVKAQDGFFKAKGDPRVTRVGRALRRYSLDEFPQFLNVLAGEMSVVGPRPLAVTTGEMEGLLREFGDTARKRFNILPGITGLWQVSGRSDVSAQQRFALDLFYVEHWSLGLDLDILLKTVPAMLSGKGAY